MSSREWLQKASRKFTPAALLAVFYVIVAAASFGGFYQKWTFRDDMPGFGAAAMLSGAVGRPFVYRRLSPWIVSGIADRVPDSVKSRLQTWSVDPKTQSSRSGPNLPGASPDSFFRYYLLYYLTFAEWFAALLILRGVCARFTGQIAGTAAPVVFALLFPLFQSMGGYFYDFGEIFFLSASVYAVIRGWWPLLLVLSVLGTLNKEAYLFFIPTLIPLLVQRMRTIPALAVAGSSVLLSGLSYEGLKYLFRTAGGGNVQIWIMQNIKFYLNPIHLLGFERTYGLYLFRAYSLISLLFIAVILVFGWKAAPRSVRWHFAIAGILNLPLLLLFAYPGEFRNLSLTFVPWTIMTAFALQRWIAQTRDV